MEPDAPVTTTQAIASSRDDRNGKENNIMPSYILRNIDPDLWVDVKARAEKEGHPLRWVILRLLAHYASKGLPK